MLLSACYKIVVNKFDIYLRIMCSFLWPNNYRWLRCFMYLKFIVQCTTWIGKVIIWIALNKCKEPKKYYFFHSGCEKCLPKSQKVWSLVRQAEPKKGKYFFSFIYFYEYLLIYREWLRSLDLTCATRADILSSLSSGFRRHFSQPERQSKTSSSSLLGNLKN